MQKQHISSFGAFALMVAIVSTACSASGDENDVATLYKDSVVLTNARMHIATFDSREKAWGGDRSEYNWQNCVTAAKLFQSQQDAKTRFWCERGYYRE